MTTTGTIPRKRLKAIPQPLWLHHEYCYFVHDQAVALIKEAELREATTITWKFKTKKESQEFNELLKENHVLDVLRIMGKDEYAKRTVINNVAMAMTSDCLHHLYEALSCLERRKFIVSLHLLRKPLMYHMLYMCWMLYDEDDFYKNFSSGNAENLSQRRIREKTKNFLKGALELTYAKSFLDAEEIYDSIYNSKNEYGLYKLFQYAVHLITIEKPELKTEGENFNFIFKNPQEDDIYFGIYESIPKLILFLVHVIFELFSRIKQFDEGSMEAFRVRTTLGYCLVSQDIKPEFAQEQLKDLFQDDLICECGESVKFTIHNSARVLMSESVRCSKCRKVSNFPFAWIF